MNISLTTEQQIAHDHIIDWVNSPKNRLLTIGGLAGTGKTTLLGEVARTIKRSAKRLALCTASGKASTILKSKLMNILDPEDYCGTIHGLIYLLVGKEQLKNGRTELYFSGKEDELKSKYDLIIIDESSMVNEWMFNDLASHGLPILAIGDHGQLPPVKGSFNLMESPDIKLETIMRQAENNPIIRMAQMARLDGIIKYGDYGSGCIKTSDSRFLHAHKYNDKNSIILCALNKTRVRMNSFAREKLGINGLDPIINEPVICLYNNKKKGVFNGSIGYIKEIEKTPYDYYQTRIDMGELIFEGDIDAQQFGKEYTNIDDESDLDYFDWAYCITTHKSQGSEWNNVLVIEEGSFLFKDDMWNRWLYTAVTRAKERLVIYKK